MNGLGWIIALAAAGVSSAGAAYAQAEGAATATQAATATTAAHPIALVSDAAPAAPAKLSAPAAPPEAPLGAAPSPKPQPPSLAATTTEVDLDSDRRWNVGLSAQFRMLAISDEDPANDRSLIWSLFGSYEVVERLRLTARIGVLQRFVATDTTQFAGGTPPAALSAEDLARLEDQSTALKPVRLQDFSLGARYDYDLDPEDVGMEIESLTMSHQLLLYLPTSIISQKRDLLLAPELRSTATLGIVERFSVSVDLSFMYRFHSFAERDGLGTGLNTQLSIGAGLGLAYRVLEDDEIGDIDLGLGGNTTTVKRYPSREAFEAETSDQEPWFQSYGWYLSASYRPIEAITVSVALEQGGPVLRDGIVNTFLLKREETELVFGVTGRY
jgi:hypothetical protein